jgi:hypothetical protein
VRIEIRTEMRTAMRIELEIWAEVRIMEEVAQSIYFVQINE